MKKYTAITIAISLLSASLITGTAQAYWVWTPETKKFINPKYAVKDTPREQYDWAMDFYDAKDYKRAATEFEKLVRNYEYSEYASKAQYYAGLSYENQGKYYIAFQNYQKAIDNFPHTENVSEIIAREYNIGNIYAAKENPKVLGTDIMTSFDRAIEIYKKVVDNEPFGKLADEAQFKMASTMKTAGRFDEATLAFQKILDDYPNSKLYEQARYEMANSAYRASLNPAYDAAPTDKALKAFEEFANTNTDTNLTKEAQATIQRLKNKAADKSFNTAEFYERLKRYDSAIIYYQDVIKTYPDSADAEIAKVRVEDLKMKNYSHKKNFDPSERKQAWIMPWAGKDKKASEVVMKTAPQEEGSGQAVSGAAKTSAKKNWWSFGLGGKEPANKSTAKPKKGWNPFNLGKKETSKNVKPAAASQTPAKKSWWSFGLGKEEPKAQKTKTTATSQTAAKKSWWSFGLGNKEAKTQKAVQNAKPVTATQSTAKKSWWSFGLGKDDKDKTPKAEKPKKSWTPLNFDKKETKAQKVAAQSYQPAESSKAPAKKSWWSFGLGNKKTKGEQ